MRLLVVLLLLFLLPAQGNCFQLKHFTSIPLTPSLNLIIAGLNYPDNNLFLQDIKEIKAGLSKIKPFDEFQEAINISYLELDNSEEQQLFKRNNGMPPVVVRMDLLEQLSRISGRYKLVILDYQGGSSCAELSSIDKTSLVILGRARYSKVEDFLKGFLHELGHSLGLRDECIDCAAVEPGFPNCAPTKELAKQWWGEYADKTDRVDYINGCCGRKDCFRPTIASVMNDIYKAADYNFANEQYLRKELSR